MLQVKRLLLPVATIALLVFSALTGTMFKASAAEKLSVKLDTTYIETAVVSELPVALTAKVLNEKGNYIYGKEIAFSVTEGDTVAEVKDGLLYVHGTGSFTVKASLSEDENVFDTCACNAVELTFSNVRILSRIENVTVYTQPILLTGSVVVDGIDFPEDVHYELGYEVVSGPAYISVGNYLYFTGEGTVRLTAYSRYDKSASVVLDIPVTDPDKGLDAEETDFSQGKLENSGSGCASFSSGGKWVGLLCFGVAVALFARLKFKEN